MSKCIKRLSNEVACQIAAGEVIERPVSVVKELLENSMDAQATEIVIHIQNGGMDLIRIEDNGQGIWEEDLALAIAPHATSKISQLEDLYHIHSKGFRGEALASIASVSRLSIISKPQAQAHAMMLSVENEQINIQPSTRAQGTTIEIKDLFFNVPVRKKFLKSTAVEWQAIEQVVKRFVVSAPHIAFRLICDGQDVLNLPIAKVAEEHLYRIQKLWGKSFQDTPIPIDMERSGMRLWGWLGQLSYHRSQNDRIWVYLNQRVIQDKLILHALKQVYTNVLPPGRYPQAVLFLEMDPCMVDINVHPAKHEVRFEQPRLIYDFILSSLKPLWHIPLESISNRSESVFAEHATANVDYKNIAYREQPWIICQAEYIILPISFNLYYMIDVPKWWLKKTSHALSQQEFPWASRQLSLPYIKEIPNLSEDMQYKIVNHVRNFGIDLQFWGTQQICIRSIPSMMPQFNLSQWIKHFRTNVSLDDLSVGHLLQCCQYSAYDVTQDDVDLMIAMVMNPEDSVDTQAFARCLDYKHCQKVFQ